MITVIFATFNGERTLPTMLEAFRKLHVPEDGWEIIAVDNASTDQTASIIHKYSDSLPITYLYQAKPGKNYALNHGLTVAKGDLIVFTDDDVIPQQDWLVQWRRCVDFRSDYGMFGGAIKPHWPRPPDEWIVSHVPLGVTYALTDDKLLEGDIFPGLIWGPNMAIRRDVFDKGYLFNTSIGPNGKNYVMGSETEFTIRLSEAGYKAWFSPKPVVQHIIREYQLDTDWIVGRAYRFGRNMFRQESKQKYNVPLLFGIPRWMIRKLVDYTFLLVVMKLKGKTVESYVYRWEINYILGYWFESRQ